MLGWMILTPSKMLFSKIVQREVCPSETRHSALSESKSCAIQSNWQHRTMELFSSFPTVPKVHKVAFKLKMFWRLELSLCPRPHRTTKDVMPPGGSNRHGRDETLAGDFGARGQMSKAQSTMDAQAQALSNRTCCREWECSHCTQVTSKGLGEFAGKSACASSVDCVRS